MGQCVVCRVEGRGQDDFVCEGCLELLKEQRLFSCHGCGISGPLPSNTLEMLECQGVRIANRRGIIVITNVCGACVVRQPGVQPQFEIHAPRILHQ